jgi:hypothetical protein
VVLKIATPAWRAKRSVITPADDDDDEEPGSSKVRRIEIKMKTKFERVIELDGDGNIVDKGDANFLPYAKFAGRCGGFEFKAGSRGCGYYRTGVKVQIPANKL